MTSLDDFMNKKKEVKSNNDKRQQVSGSFACQECNLYAPYALMDQSNNLEWYCPDGHTSYGRL